MKRWIVIVLGVVVAVGAAGAGLWYFLKRDKGEQYRTGRVEFGDLVQTVRATGTVQPIKLVQVGTQVNGPVQKLYVDYNDSVKQGDLVAQIDPTVYEARLAQDQANLAQGLANVEEAQARLAQAEKELERSRELAKRDMLSQQELDAAVASRDTLTAQLKVAQAAVEQIKAALRLSRANLDYTTIRSPVNGVVIARNVDEGQTVVASMSAQVLFQIATDLREVQVVASIPEADIGKIRAEQPVTFTVDAYDQDFTGAVQQVRLASATVQNVVTYPVVVRANNPDGRLFPGMTANASFEVARRDGVLKVPNGALRFTPSTAAPKGQPPAAGGANKSHGPKVWIQKTPGAAPEPIAVTLGITDGSFTELKDPVKLREGQEVLVGLAEKGSTDQGTVNPFVPRFPGRRR